MSLFGSPHICGYTNHRYEPRYDVKPSRMTATEMTTGETHTYVQDVCVHCGSVVHRGKPAFVDSDSGAAASQERTE